MSVGNANVIPDQPSHKTNGKEKTNGNVDMKAVLTSVNDTLKGKFDRETISQAMRMVLGVESRKDVPPEKWRQIRDNLGSFVSAVETTCEELTGITEGEDSGLEELVAAPGA